MNHLTMKEENIYGIIESQVDLLFGSICEEFDLESGDISPQLQARLDKCLEELEEIVGEFIEKN